MDLKLNLSDEVIAYLNSTRIIQPEINSSLGLQDIWGLVYTHKIEYINYISKLLNIDAKIEIIYSDALKSEAIILKNFKGVIHDQHLGQTLNTLNRLFLFNTSNETIAIFFHKLLSKIFSRYGFYEEAIFAARFYLHNRSKMDLQEKQKEANTFLHGIYVDIQELYIMLHEHSHIVLKQKPDLLIQLEEHVRDFISEYSKKLKNPNNLKNVFLNYDPHLRIDELECFLTDNYKAFVDQSINICYDVIDRCDLIEEFCCDHLAIIHILPYIQSSGLNLSEVIRIIVLCFLHLRTLRLLETRCTLENNIDFYKRSSAFDLGENLYTTFYNLRLHYIKEICYDLLIKDSSQSLEIHKDIYNLMNEHCDKILTPGEAIVTKLLYDKDIRGLMSDEFDFIKDKLSNNQGLNRLVSSILHAVEYKNDEEQIKD